MRRNVADAYVNLGRRNQNLLSRQLEFITQLENDESDPETLEHLFRLDHLATRMRRNAESLLVLAGLAPPRTWSAPVAMGDVVRGALGEVEGYRRVRLRHVDEARVDGSAAADVSHVIAELVENALSFSPPDADVEVYGRRDDHGYVITIVDSGIGMHDEELERANSLISSANALTLAPSRFLGHYVVAQLAARHGLTVHLAASPAGGLTALDRGPGRVARYHELARGPGRGRRGCGSPRRRPTPNVRRTVCPAGSRRRRAPAAPIAFRAAAAPPPLPAELSPEPVHEVDLDDSFGALDEIDDIDSFDEIHIAESVDDSPADVTPVAESAPAPEPEPQPEPTPAPSVESAPAPEVVTPPVPEAPPARPRLGLGTFADLRGASSPPPVVQPAEPDPEPVTASASAPASTPAPVADPDRPPMIAPDRRASFAEVAQAVDVPPVVRPNPRRRSPRTSCRSDCLSVVGAARGWKLRGCGNAPQ